MHKLFSSPLAFQGDLPLRMHLPFHTKACDIVQSGDLSNDGTSVKHISLTIVPTSSYVGKGNLLEVI